MFADQFSTQQLAIQRHNDLLREARSERLAAAAKANDLDTEDLRHVRAHGVALRLAHLLGAVHPRPARSC